MEFFDLASALVFYALVLFFVYKKRSRFQKYYGIFFLYRMRIGLKFMELFGEKFGSFLKVFATIGVVISFYFMFLIPKMLFDGALEIIQAEDAVAQVAILLPGIRVPGSSFFVPFWYGIVSIVLIAFFHEFGHGVVGAAEGLKPKNDGFGFLFFIPVFFVEHDDKSLSKKQGMQRMRIAAAGPTANLLTGILALMLLNYSLSPVLAELFVSEGVLITSVLDGFPAQISGLGEGEIVSSVNGTQILNSSYFVSYLDERSPGQGLLIGTDRKEFYLTLVSNPDNESAAYMGVTFTNNVVKNSLGSSLGFVSDFFMVFSKFLTWFAFLSFGVGIMNFLPVSFVDGGQILYNLVLYFFKNEKRAVKVLSGVFWIVLMLLLFNLVGPFFL